MAHFQAYHTSRLNYARVCKESSTEFTLLVASAEDHPSVNAVHEIEVEGNKVNLTIEYGDFSGPLQKSIDALKEVLCLTPIIDIGLP